MRAPNKSLRALSALVVAATAVIAFAAAPAAEAANVFVKGRSVGSAGQFGYAAGISVRNDGQTLVADENFNDQKVWRFNVLNELQNTTSISSTGGGQALNCVTRTGGSDFIVNSPWDRPIRKYDESGNEVGYVNGGNMYLNNGFNGKAGPGNVECVVRSGDYLFAISDRGSGSSIPSLSRWNISDLSLGPDVDGPPFGGYLTGLAADFNGDIFVVDSGSDKLHSYDENLQHRWSTSNPWTGGGTFVDPTEVAVDSPNALVYVVDNGLSEIPSDNRLVAFSTVDGSFVKTVKLGFNVSAITFDQTNGWEPILGAGNSVYRGQFAVQPVVRMAAKPPRNTGSKTATFRFSSDEPNTRLTCKLDSGRAKPCLSSARFRGLSRGRHRLKVTGKLADGNGIASKAVTYAWNVR